MMASLTICKDLVSKKKVFLTAGDVTHISNVTAFPIEEPNFEDDD